MQYLVRVIFISLFSIYSTMAIGAGKVETITDLLSSTEITPKQTNGDAISGNVKQQDEAAKKKLDIGSTGLALPRFVSLKRDKVNVRKGPNESFDIAWTYNLKNLPIEIIAEYDNWRKIRDHLGSVGWVFHSLLSGTRYGMINPWEKGGFFTIHSSKSDSAKIVAKLESGVLVRIKTCDGNWCQLNVETRQGYIKQDLLWGIYPGDEFK